MSPDVRWRFAAFYFCYYAALGAYTPYVARWVDALGHGGYVIGTMLGLWYGSRILAPPLWAALVRRSERPGQWFVAGSAVALLSFAAFALTESALGLFAVVTLFGLFYNAVMPQFEAMTLTALGTRVADYGRLRIWGSVGFLLTAGGFGPLLDHFGSAAFPWLTLPLLAAMLAAAVAHRHDRPTFAEPGGVDGGRLWKRPGVRRFLSMALLMQVGFGPFYVFYTLHLQAHGHDGLAVGALWAIGVLVEIVLFWRAPWLIERFGAPRLLSACMAATVLRWLATALFADSFAIMAVAQCSHALGFAVFHACCMRLIVEYFPGRGAISGQSLLYGFSSGVGGVLGAGLAALMWERGGGTWAFLAGAVVVAVAWAVHTSRERPT